MNLKNRCWHDGGSGAEGAGAQIYALHRALLAQLTGGVIVATLLFALLRRGIALEGTQLLFAMLQGGVAALVAQRQRAPDWWLLIHLGFLPLVVVAHRLQLPPWLYLVGFILLLAIFWRTDRSRVPLYLTSSETARVLSQLLASQPQHVIDLGCGQGGLLCRLARLRPECHFVGIEHAPLPWLIAHLSALRLPNVTIRRGDFWSMPLTGYDCVYAFLSPAPMVRLWEKACREMTSGALLISNSFEIPQVAPDRTVTVGDRRKTHLLLYRPNNAGDFAAIPPISIAADRE